MEWACGSARVNYRQFVAEGIEAGRRDELIGGGLRPSKKRAPAAARGLMFHLAKYELGYTGKEIGKFIRSRIDWSLSGIQAWRKDPEGKPGFVERAYG